MAIGRVVHVVGPVVDVEFYSERLPALHNALRIREEEQNLDIVLEVAEHLGDNVVRSIAMSSTRGLSRGVSVEPRSPATVENRTNTGVCFPFSAKIDARVTSVSARVHSK